MAEDESKRDGGVLVLIWNTKDGGTDFREFDTKKDALAHVEVIGGPSKVTAFYVGAKPRTIRAVTSYTF